MTKDAAHYMEVIGKKLLETVSDENHAAHGEFDKIDAKKLARTLKDLRTAMDSLQPHIKKTFEEEQKLSIPALDQKVRVIIDEFKKMDAYSQELFRIANVLENNDMFPSSEAKPLKDLRDGITQSAFQIQEQYDELMVLVEQDESELHKLENEAGNRHKWHKVSSLLKKSQK